MIPDCAHFRIVMTGGLFVGDTEKGAAAAGGNEKDILPLPEASHDTFTGVEKRWERWSLKISKSLLENLFSAFSAGFSSSGPVSRYFFASSSTRRTESPCLSISLCAGS